MSNFTHTKVDPNRLSKAALNIDDSLRLAQNALSAIENSLDNTLRPTWSGPASTQFFARYADDMKSAGLLFKELRDYNDKLRQAAGAYDNADGRAGELVSNLRLGAGSGGGAASGTGGN